jgi:ribosomal protein S1
MLFTQIKRKSSGLKLDSSLINIKNSTDPDASQFIKFIDNKFKFPVRRNKGRLMMVSVVHINDEFVIVDFKGKQEGKIPIEEMNLYGHGALPKVGDNLEAWVQGDQVSFAKGAQIRAWSTLESHYKNKKPLEGIITEKTANGFVVSILPFGARGFLPISQLESSSQILKNPQALQKYKDIPHSYTIIKMDKNTDRSMFIVLSRRIESIADSNDENDADNSNSAEGDS